MKKLIFSICLVTLCLLFSPGFQNASSAVLLDRIVAAVNEEAITWSELMNAIIIDGKQLLGGATGSAREEKIREIERPFLNQMIEMKLQLQEARRMDLYVDGAEIDGAINDIKTKYGLTEETLMDSLKAEGLTAEDYKSRLADQILLQKVVNAAVRNNVVVPDEEIEQYYEDNKNKFDVTEKMRISQIFFVIPEGGAQKEALEATARELVQRINSGEDFGELAREFSEDPSSEFGGDLGYISLGSALKEVENAAAALKAGEVSEPFWSPAGLHIIKLQDRIGSKGIEQVRDSIRDELHRKAFDEDYREWKAGLREQAYIEIKL
jgi:peptidyl-prolyl cis-trans isomerase SurA